MVDVSDSAYNRRYVKLHRSRGFRVEAKCLQIKDLADPEVETGLVSISPHPRRGGRGMVPVLPYQARLEKISKKFILALLHIHGSDIMDEDQEGMGMMPDQEERDPTPEEIVEAEATDAAIDVLEEVQETPPPAPKKRSFRAVRETPDPTGQNILARLKILERRVGRAAFDQVSLRAFRELKTMAEALALSE